MTITGTVQKAVEEQTRNNKTITHLVLNVPVRKWQHGREETVDGILAVKCFGRMANTAKNLEPGARVNVTFSVESREWNGRYFSDVVAQHIEWKGAPQTQQDLPTEPSQAPGIPDGDDDGIPF